jgi:hypothetical protein
METPCAKQSKTGGLKTKRVIYTVPFGPPGGAISHLVWLNFLSAAARGTLATCFRPAPVLQILQTLLNRTFRPDIVQKTGRNVYDRPLIVDRSPR